MKIKYNVWQLNLYEYISTNRIPSYIKYFLCKRLDIEPITFDLHSINASSFHFKESCFLKMSLPLDSPYPDSKIIWLLGTALHQNATSGFMEYL
jgi:hypothetical protein